MRMPGAKQGRRGSLAAWHAANSLAAQPLRGACMSDRPRERDRDDVVHGGLSRRAFLQAGSLVIVTASTPQLLTACGGDNGEDGLVIPPDAPDAGPEDPGDMSPGCACRADAGGAWEAGAQALVLLGAWRWRRRRGAAS